MSMEAASITQHCQTLRLGAIGAQFAALRPQTFVPFLRAVTSGRMQSASGLRESATNRLGEHGGKPKGDAAAMQKFSMSRLNVGGFLFGHPDACFTLIRSTHP
jgi:hypothetical protein